MGTTSESRARASRGSRYLFGVQPDGTSEAYYDNPNESIPTYQSHIAIARLTDSMAAIPVREVYDNRQEN